MKRLQNAQDLRRYLSNLINRTEAGIVDVNLGKSLAYMSSILLRIIEGGDLEGRVEQLERKLELKRKKGDRS
jgi:GH24 family phage-related lysozyme (muramidase)